MTTDARELKIYIDNDGDLYRQQTTSILKNLATKRARGVYKHDLAVKLFGYLVEAGAKKYVKQYDAPNAKWHDVFNVATRKAVAEDLARDFEAEAKLGNYDNLLPKKYQKSDSSAHATKKKTMADYEREGYDAHTWWIADSPYTQPKIRDAWQKGAWKWMEEQRARDRASGKTPSKDKSSHARRKKMSARNARTLKKLEPLRTTYGSTYAGPRTSPKSPAQLDREIAQALGSRRGR
jgi:hypothetical protein